MRVRSILGVDLTREYDPADVWRPWIGHWFPAIGPAQMWRLTFGQIVEMHEFVTANTGD